MLSQLSQPGSPSASISALAEERNPRMRSATLSTVQALGGAWGSSMIAM